MDADAIEVDSDSDSEEVSAVALGARAKQSETQAQTQTQTQRKAMAPTAKIVDSECFLQSVLDLRAAIGASRHSGVPFSIVTAFQPYLCDADHDYRTE